MRQAIAERWPSVLAPFHGRLIAGRYRGVRGAVSTKFLAGVLVAYMLIDADGVIAAADLVSHHDEQELDF